MASERILELLRRPSDPDEHEEIREIMESKRDRPARSGRFVRPPAGTPAEVLASKPPSAPE